MTSIRIFQIGFNCCGTKTIHDYLCANGLKGVHFEEGKLARRIFANRERGLPLISGYESCHVFTDMEWIGPRIGPRIGPSRYLEAYKLYREFADQHPEAAFILNTRDVENWINSRLSHQNGSYAALHKSFLKLESDSELINHWRKEWYHHHQAVTKFFSERQHRFTVCRIEKDLPDVLNEMLPELKLDRSVYFINRGEDLQHPNHFQKKRISAAWLWKNFRRQLGIAFSRVK